MREVAGEPEQLQLKGEDERVERGLGRKRGLDVVEEVEEARQRIEGGRVGVLLDEEAKHRLEADVAHRHAVAVDAPALVGAQKVGAAHGAELPLPSCSMSSTWLKGSSRAPKRDFVLRTPLAIAPTRPRSRV